MRPCRRGAGAFDFCADARAAVHPRSPSSAGTRRDRAHAFTSCKSNIRRRPNRASCKASPSSSPRRESSVRTCRGAPRPRRRRAAATHPLERRRLHHGREHRGARQHGRPPARRRARGSRPARSRRARGIFGGLIRDEDDARARTTGTSRSGDRRELGPLYAELLGEAVHVAPSSSRGGELVLLLPAPL
jgi:hypothetical protein